MSLYKKLPCICGHEYDSHISRCKVCFCEAYDPAGHNPDLENVLCPKCEIVHLEKMGDWYVCVACSHTMTEVQVWELVG